MTPCNLCRWCFFCIYIPTSTLIHLKLALCSSTKESTPHVLILHITSYRYNKSTVRSCASLVYTLIDVTSNDTAAEGSVRLVGGDTVLEGRVEIFLLGQWGTVCDERWDHVDATVVCRELGYPRAVEAPGLAFFGAGSGPSWYSSVRCVGTERNLTDCSKSTYNLGSACPHSQDAGVVCSSECIGRIILFSLYDTTVCFF